MAKRTSRKRHSRANAPRKRGSSKPKRTSKRAPVRSIYRGSARERVEAGMDILAQAAVASRQGRKDARLFSESKGLYWGALGAMQSGSLSEFMTDADRARLKEFKATIDANMAHYYDGAPAPAANRRHSRRNGWSRRASRGLKGKRRTRSKRTSRRNGAATRHVPAGARVHRLPHRSAPGQGLTYGPAAGVMMEEGRVGPQAGWDVYDIRLDNGAEESAYGFDLRIGSKRTSRRNTGYYYEGMSHPESYDRRGRPVRRNSRRSRRNQTGYILVPPRSNSRRNATDLAEGSRVEIVGKRRGRGHGDHRGKLGTIKGAYVRDEYLVVTDSGLRLIFKSSMLRPV